MKPASLSIKVSCCCGAAMETRALEEASPLLYHLTLACLACANWMAVSGRPEEIEPWVTRTLWSREARHELERLPPHIEPLVRGEVETYADKNGVCLITLSLLQEARNRGQVSWSREAGERLANIPAAVRAMAKIEIERMAIERGLPEVTESLMNEAKLKFLGMRG